MRRGGFSLIEISVVLIVVSVMISGILPYISESQKTNAANDTMDRIEAIETAMLTYRAANSKIPCPSNIQATLNSAAFGTADTTASCAAATNFTDANTAAGGVPTKTLGLPDEMGFDGWGRRMVYHVAKALTVAGTYSGGAGSITVNDAAGTARTTAAAYAIVSHGPNGHGAYTRAGGTARFNFGSTNASEQENCECNASATATAYDSILAQFMATPNTNPLAAYDDIVRYTLKPNLELLVGGGGGGGYWTAGTGGNINDIYNANSGNVGIGTTTPVAKLDVFGGINYKSATATDSNGVAYGTTTQNFDYTNASGTYKLNHYGMTVASMPSSAATYVSGYGELALFTQGANRLHVNQAGNVGIGTASPTHKLEVWGDIFTTGAFRSNMFGTHGSTVPVCFSGTGYFDSCTSLRKFKKNIRDLEVSLDAVMKLRPVSYSWKEDNVTDIGFIAEEAVAVDSRFGAVGTNGKLVGVKYDHMVALAIKSIQDLKRQFDAQIERQASEDGSKAKLSTARELSLPEAIFWLLMALQSLAILALWRRTSPARKQE